LTKFLSSMKFGLILMVAIAISSIISTILPVLKEQTMYSSFIKAFLVLPKLLMIVLCINLLFCTARRFPAVLRQINEDLSFENEKDLKEQKSFEETYNMPKVNTSYDRFLENYFIKNKYKYKKITSQENIYFLAQKGNLSLIAPHLLHIGIAIVLIGALLGNIYGAKGRIGAKVGESVKVPVQVSENMVIKVDGFKTIYDDQNNIDNWQSDITVIIDKNQVIHGTTKVNHPFRYKGVAFYQTAYDYLHAVTLNINGMNEQKLTIKNRSLDRTAAILLGKTFIIKKLKDEVQLIIFESHKKYDVIPLQEEQSIEFPNGTLKYLGTDPYIVLTAKKDPGIPIVMLGFLIIVLASTLFWTSRFKKVRISLDKNKQVIHLSITSKSKAIKEQIKTDLISYCETVF